MAADSRTAGRDSSVPLDSVSEAMSDSGCHAPASSAIQSSACTAVPSPAAAIPPNEPFDPSTRPSDPSPPATRSNSPSFDEFPSGNYTYFPSAQDDESPDSTATGWNREYLAIGRHLHDSSPASAPTGSADQVVSLGSQFASTEASQTQPEQADGNIERTPCTSHGVLHRDSGFAGSRSSTFQDGQMPGSAINSTPQRTPTQQTLPFSDHDSGFGDSRTSTFHEASQPAIAMSRPSFHRSSIPFTRAEALRTPGFPRTQSFTFRAAWMSDQPTLRRRGRRSSFHTVPAATQEVGSSDFEKPLLFDGPVAAARKQQLTDSPFRMKPDQFGNHILSLAGKKDEILKLGRQALQIPLRLRAYEVFKSIQECDQNFSSESLPAAAKELHPNAAPEVAVKLEDPKSRLPQEVPASSISLNDTLIQNKNQDLSLPTAVPIHSVPAYRTGGDTGSGNRGGPSGWAGASNQGSSYGHSSAHGSTPGSHQGQGKGNGLSGSPEDPSGKGRPDAGPESQCVFCDVGLQLTDRKCELSKAHISQWKQHHEHCHRFFYCLYCATAFRSKPQSHSCEPICLETGCINGNFGRRTAQQRDPCTHQKDSNSSIAKRNALQMLAVLRFHHDSRYRHEERIDFDEKEYKRLRRQNGGQARFPVEGNVGPYNEEFKIPGSQRSCAPFSDRQNPSHGEFSTALPSGHLPSGQVTDVSNVSRLDTQTTSSIAAVERLLCNLKAWSELSSLPNDSPQLTSFIHMMADKMNHWVQQSADRMQAQQLEQAEMERLLALEEPRILVPTNQNILPDGPYHGLLSTQPRPTNRFADSPDSVNPPAPPTGSWSDQAIGTSESDVFAVSVRRHSIQPIVDGPEGQVNSFTSPFPPQPGQAASQQDFEHLPPAAARPSPLSSNSNILAESSAASRQRLVADQPQENNDWLSSFFNLPEASAPLPYPHGTIPDSLNNQQAFNSYDNPVNPAQNSSGRASSGAQGQHYRGDSVVIPGQNSSERASSGAQGQHYRGKGKHRAEPYSMYRPGPST